MRHLNKVLLLLFAPCAFAGTWIASPGKGSHGGAAAPFNQWYYAGTGNTDTSFLTDSFGSFNTDTTANGSAITVPASGTLTHLSFYGYSNSGSTDFKVALYDNSNNLVVSGGPQTVSSTGVAWYDVDVTDTAVTAGTYKLMFSCSASPGRFYYLNNQDGINSTVAYASFPANPLGSPGTLTNSLPGVRAFITNKPIATFRSIASTTYASRTNTTVSAPSGVTNGDVLIMVFIIAGASPPSATLPGGWTVIQGPTTLTAGGFSVIRRLAWKVASGEGANYTITHTSASSQAVIVDVQNASSSTPVSSSNSALSGANITGTGVTAPTDQSMIMFVGQNWDLFGSTSPPTGTTPIFTERLDDAASLLYVATGTLPTAAATGDKTVVNPNSANPWSAFLVAVGGGP